MINESSMVESGWRQWVILGLCGPVPVATSCNVVGLNVLRKHARFQGPRMRKKNANYLISVEMTICYLYGITLCEELTHWKRLWCWEGLGVGEEGDDRGWDGWMASLIRWTWVWVNSRSWWWTGRPGVLQFMGSQRVGHDWATELNWIDD